ncbi:hypothetical protein EDD17DRAFT_1776489 [Pisolithus thermaeus]|nr:hypothetical protein EV401DRAFT_2061209 [Pisolithus croceorrhizus]KAI6162424.1 hypothetical protein EDD17DRAFT_1776489 [Pisolithus thermaeus]
MWITCTFFSTSPLMNYSDNKHCWPQDHCILAFWSVRHGLPRSLTTIKWEDTFISIYSRENGGFKVQILLNIRTLGREQFSLKDAVWNFTNEQTKECIMTTQAFLHVSDDNEGIQQFSNSSSRIVNKWNTASIGLIMYYCEVVIHVNELLDALVKAENNTFRPMSRSA